MCGIVGIVAKTHVNQSIYDALTVLQHRGQDAAGIVTSDQGKFYLRKDNGLVGDVFRTRHMRRLVGNMGIGHVRYPTAGSSSSAEAQPFYVNSPYGIVLAHNGNLTNTADLSEDIYREDLRHINTTSDSEVLLNIFAHELQEQKQLKPTPESVFEAIKKVHKRIRGGYAVVAMICGFGIVAFRDPNGIRPVVFGKRSSDEGDEFMVASESVALDGLGYKLERDLAPGEALVITEGGEIFTQQCAEETRLTPCLFEQVYFARPDSIIDGIAVYKARLRMGEKLAEKIIRDWPDHDIDVVIPIPDTSRTSALELANRLGVKYREGFMKNRYIGRTFIMPGQQQRKKSVRQKLNALDLEFRGKNVLLVDDSIVRGTTCEQIIEMARDAGAQNVYFASAAPAVRFPNVYGIDMPAKEDFIAHNRTTEQIADEIGADRLIYQDLEDLKDACLEGSKTTATDFDSSVFDGTYVTGDVNDQYFARLSLMRGNSADSAKAAVENVGIDLHNESES
ncbi:MAG: amidophosphoribosyltransferase [Oceanospirillaceae bacterium]|nr:amidophosphoribosyltransferase [Oceanospirillaceae bacterium]